MIVSIILRLLPSADVWIFSLGNGLLSFATIICVDNFYRSAILTFDSVFELKTGVSVLAISFRQEMITV